MTAVFAGVAVLAFFGWFRTRRFEKVIGRDMAIALAVGAALYFFDVSSVAAAVVLALALVIVAPPRAWVPLAVVGVFEVTLEPWDELGYVGSPNFGWFAYEPPGTVTWGSQPDWYMGWSDENGLASSFSTLDGVEMSRAFATVLFVEPGVPIAALVLAAGLLGWATRRRSIPVAVVAATFGTLLFFSPGPSLLLLAAATFAVVPFGRWYPFLAGGVVLLVPVLHDAVRSVTPYTRFPWLDPVWLWLAAIVISTGLVVWSLARKDFVACVLAIAALLVTWPAKPDPPGLQFLSQTAPAPLPMIFPAALPALVLLAAAFVRWRRKA